MGTASLPFEFCIVDEAQDISVAELRFLAVLGAGRPNSLFFAGDLGQRIFQAPFSWYTLGIDVRGRSKTLRINYRASHQIRLQADRLLPRELADMDGIIEQRGNTVSVFNGPEPCIKVLDRSDEEAAIIAEWLRARCQDAHEPHEIAVFSRPKAEITRALEAMSCGLSATMDGLLTLPWEGLVGTMHLAKGLEFRAVVVAACDDEVLPHQSRIENAADDSDLEDIYSTERHLLYVACTRARDHLLVTGVEPASEFLDDLKIDSDFR